MIVYARASELSVSGPNTTKCDRSLTLMFLDGDHFGNGGLQNANIAACGIPLESLHVNYARGRKMPHTH
jgi:hypothetical protein